MSDSKVPEPNEVNTILIAVVQSQDADGAQAALHKLGLSITRLPSVGGFLGRRNATLLIGLPVEKKQVAIDSLNESCRQRVEFIAVPLESAPLPLPAPTPITIGGATIFSLEIDHYEEI
jgi:uncharacterized protein YaaQ